MKIKYYSLILDFFQGATIITISLIGPLVSHQPISFGLQLIFISLLAQAIWDMRKTAFYRIPDFGKQKAMITTGIYKYIRNPMYLSELLFTGAIVGTDFSSLKAILYLILFTDLLLKIRYEEGLLSSNFKEFLRYKKSSWRLIPHVY